LGRARPASPLGDRLELPEPEQWPSTSLSKRFDS
jgi:hypothetical protein